MACAQRLTESRTRLKATSVVDSDLCGKDEVLLICGSLYIMNEVRYAMGIREPQDVIYDYHCRDHGPDSVAAGEAQYLYPHEKPKEWN